MYQRYSLNLRKTFLIFEVAGYIKLSLFNSLKHSDLVKVNVNLALQNLIKTEHVPEPSISCSSLSCEDGPIRFQSIQCAFDRLQSN